MANLQKKIWIDNFLLKDTRIITYTLIDDESVDFDINKSDFETWADENEMREWENYSYNYMKEDFDEYSGTHEWSAIYADHAMTEKFLKEYIQHLYIMEMADELLVPLKLILSTFKPSI